MTNKQIEAMIKRTQKKVNTILSIEGVEGEVTITNIIKKEKDFKSFLAVQDRIEEEVVIKKGTVKILLFFVWKK